MVVSLKNYICCLILIITVFCAVTSYAIQDEMAYGRFIPSKVANQLVVFHFERGKTHARFFEKVDDSLYLFPIYEVMMRGVLQDRPVIEDINNDGFLEISYETSAERGIIYYDKSRHTLIKIHPNEKEKRKLTHSDEMKLLDNDNAIIDLEEN